MAPRDTVRTASRRVDRRLLAAAGAWWLGMYALLFVGQGRFSLHAVSVACGRPAPDTRFAPSPRQTELFLIGCGDQGLRAYRDLQIADLFYPVSTALLLVLTLTYLRSHVTPPAAWLTYLPVLAAAGDYLENVCAWVLIAAASPRPSWATHVLQIGSVVKFVASWLAWLTVIALLVLWVARRLRPAASARPAASGLMTAPAVSQDTWRRRRHRNQSAGAPRRASHTRG